MKYTQQCIRTSSDQVDSAELEHEPLHHGILFPTKSQAVLGAMSLSSMLSTIFNVKTNTLFEYLTWFEVRRIKSGVKLDF